MNFWKRERYPYMKVVEISEYELILLLSALTRDDIIEWLIWNDPNGVYDDHQSLKEFGNTMSREEGIEIILRQAKENKIINA
jgi:hypothetical protein